MDELRLVPWSVRILVLVGCYRKSLLCCWPFWPRVLFSPDFYHVVTWGEASQGARATLSLSELGSKEAFYFTRYTALGVLP